MRYVFCLAFVLLILAVPGLSAADAPAGGEKSVMSWEWDTAVWTIVVFLLLFGILFKFAWPEILKGLQTREENIALAVEEAKKARNETEQLRAKFQKDLDEAYAKIPAMMDEARRDAEALKEEIRSKANADIAAERQRLRREIDVATDQSLEKIRDHAAQLATLISAKAIGRNMNEDDHRRLIDEALVEMRQSR